MKSTQLKSLVLITSIAVTSLVAIARPLDTPSGETAYPAIPAVPPYIAMDDSFQVFSIAAP